MSRRRAPSASRRRMRDAAGRWSASGGRFGGLAGSSGRGGEHDLAGAVEHADAVDALLERDGLHDLIGGLAVVVEHGVPGGAGDALGELVGAEDHGVEELAFFGLDIDEAGNGGHDDDDHGDREHQFRGRNARISAVGQLEASRA